MWGSGHVCLFVVIMQKKEKALLSLNSLSKPGAQWFNQSKIIHRLQLSWSSGYTIKSLIKIPFPWLLSKEISLSGACSYPVNNCDFYYFMDNKQNDTKVKRNQKDKHWCTWWMKGNSLLGYWVKWSFIFDSWKIIQLPFIISKNVCIPWICC